MDDDDLESVTPDGEVPPAAAAPQRGFWLADLFWNPTRFFGARDLMRATHGTALAAFAVGVTLAMNRFERAQERGDSALAQLDTWPGYWVMSLLGGVMSAALYLWFGGWWYRLRLRWSGARNPDPGLARRVYVYASLVFALPELFAGACKTALYSSPAAAAGSDWSMLLSVFLIWSVVTSYKGARQSFDLALWPGRVWFLVLPLLTYGLAFALALFMATATGGASLESAPDTEHGITLERPGFRLTYPANWRIDTQDEDYDPDADFGIAPVYADALIRFSLYDEPLNVAQRADAWLADVGGVFGLTQVRETVRWGGVRGKGYRARGRIEDDDFVVVLFCGSSERRSFEVLRITVQEAEGKLAPGFRQIRESFQLKP